MQSVYGIVTFVARLMASFTKLNSHNYKTCEVTKFKKGRTHRNSYSFSVSGNIGTYFLHVVHNLDNFRLNSTRLPSIFSLVPSLSHAPRCEKQSGR